jgi:HTH-type transcriptional regulator / antitoxin HigA
MTGQAAVVVGPGTVLQRELTARGWTQRDLAEVMGRPVQAVNEIVKGGKQVTAETARQLAEALGTSPDLWLNLETAYRLSLAQQPSHAIARRRRLYDIAPVGELLRRGWLGPADDVEGLERDLLQFLGIKSVDDEPALPVAGLRATETRDPEPRAQTAWIKRAEALARKQTLSVPFDRGRLERDLPALLASSVEDDGHCHVPSYLLGRGVHFVLIPHLPKTYMDGAAFTLNGRPVVGMTLRYDRIDYFWFTLTHELAHVVLGHKGVIDHFGREDGHTAIEDEANAKAMSWLIEPKAYKAFLTRTDRRPTRADILAFAEQVQRHPAIVVGRLHHQRVLAYGRHRDLLGEARRCLAAWIDRPAAA